MERPNNNGMINLINEINGMINLINEKGKELELELVLKIEGDDFVLWNNYHKAIVKEMVRTKNLHDVYMFLCGFVALMCKIENNDEILVIKGKRLFQ